MLILFININKFLDHQRGYINYNKIKCLPYQVNVPGGLTTQQPARKNTEDALIGVKGLYV